MLPEDYREFIELLNAQGVKYLIVGGYAVAYHGHPRTTGDIDFFIEASRDNASKMERVIEQFGLANQNLSAQDFNKPEAVVQLGYVPCRIDIVTTIDGVDFSEAWRQKLEVDLDGTPVFIIAKELLLKNKAKSGRPQDVADIDHLTNDSA